MDYFIPLLFFVNKLPLICGPDIKLAAITNNTVFSTILIAVHNIPDRNLM